MRMVVKTYKYKAVQQCKTHEYRALIIPAPVIHLYGEQGQDESDWFASTTPP
jgi:hypothetical protein